MVFEVSQRAADPSGAGDTTPLSGDRFFASGSPAYAADRVAEFLTRHTLTVRGPVSGRFDGLVNFRRFQDVTLSYFRYGAEVDIASAPLGHVYAINATLSGQAHVRRGGEEFVSGVGQAALFSPSGPSSMRWSPDFTVLCVTIERRALERRLETLIAEPVDHIDFHPRLSLTPGSDARAWWEMVRILLSLPRPDIDSGPPALVICEIEQALMSSLLLTQEHPASGALRRTPVSASHRIVDEAIDIMRAESGRALAVGEIAARIGVSERSLQLAFRRRTAMSPTAFLRQLRLDNAHRILRSTAPAERTIAQVASDCGFSHLGRFAQAYQRRFGVRPSQTSRPA